MTVPLKLEDKMLHITDLTKQKSHTSLESANITEKINKKIGEVGDFASLEKKSKKEQDDFFWALSQIEKGGIADYISQIIKFLNGYDLAELPYIVHALRKITEALTNICKEADDNAELTLLCDKIELLWQMYGDSRVTLLSNNDTLEG